MITEKLSSVNSARPLERTANPLVSVFSLVAILIGVLIAATVTRIGPLALLVIPIFVLFAFMFGKPDIGLFLFNFITCIQLSNVLIQSHGLPSIARLLAGLLFVIILIRMSVYRERPTNWLSAGPVILIYLSSVLISLLYAEDFVVAQQAFLGLMKDALGAFIVLYLVQSPVSLRRAIWALVLSGTFMGTISIYQSVTGAYADPLYGFGAVQHFADSSAGGEHRERISGPYGNPNAYAQMMIVIVPLALDRLWREKSTFLRLLAGYTGVICIITVFITYSRGGFLSLVATLALFFAWRRYNLMLIFVSAVVLLIAMQFLPVSYGTRIATLLEFWPGGGKLYDPSFRGRLSENTAALMMFQEHPVLGVGLGHFSLNYQDYSRQIGLDRRRTARTPASFYLELLSERGLIGILIFAYFMYFMYKGLLKAQKNFEKAGLIDAKYMSNAILIGLTGYLMSAIVKNSAFANVFWILVGIALATYQVSVTSLQKSGERANAAEVNGKLNGRYS